MTDVFISYARKDWAIAKALVDLLQAKGYAVWWDKDLIGGSGFREQIRERLMAAKVVLVIWSPDAIRSDWVRGEASHGLETGKLLSTKVPWLAYDQLSTDFSSQQTVNVKEVGDVTRVLDAKGILKRADLIERDDDGIKLRQTIDKWQCNSQSDVAIFLPVVVFFVSMTIGIALIAVSNLIGIGWVDWMPTVTGGQAWVRPKQVGYIPAVNWSLASVLLFPLAWGLVMLATQTLFDIRRQLVRDRMIVTVDFEPIEEGDERLQRMWRGVRRMVNWLIGFVTVFILGFALLDYVTVVDRIYTDPQIAAQMNEVGPQARIALTHTSFERDWSVATALVRTDQVPENTNLNRAFALLVYVLYPGLSVGIMFSFFFVLVGIGMFFIPGAARHYGLLVIPNVNSIDERRGFEAFGGFFGNAVSITALCFVICYLMFLQNVYLRVEAPTLLSFVSPEVGRAQDALVRGDMFVAIDALFGYSLGEKIPTGAIQSVLAWFICAFMAITLLGIAYLLAPRRFKWVV